MTSAVIIVKIPVQNWTGMLLNTWTRFLLAECPNGHLYTIGDVSYSFCFTIKDSMA